MEVGYGERDITPPLGIRLGGYANRFGKPSTLVHDQLFIKSIYIGGHKDLLLLSADLLGIYKKFADDIKSAIRKEVGKISVFFATTHTHSAPETIIPMWVNTFPYSYEEKTLLSGWMESLKEKAVEAAVEAYYNASRASVKYCSTTVPNLTYNRSYKNGLVDPQLSIIYFNCKNNNKILITNYACHPVCNTDLGISADYPGELSARLLKYGFKNFFTLGASGNIDPIRKGREFASKMGKVLSNNIIECLKGSIELSCESLNIETRKLSLKLRKPPINKANKKIFSILRVVNPRFLRLLLRFWGSGATKLLYMDELETIKDDRDFIETIIQVFTMDNELAFITIPGEPFVEIGAKIKEIASSLGYKTVIIATCSDDYIGYIPTKEAFKLETYETKLARWSRVTDEAENIIYREIKKMLVPV